MENQVEHGVRIVMVLNYFRNIRLLRKSRTSKSPFVAQWCVKRGKNKNAKEKNSADKRCYSFLPRDSTALRFWC